MIMLSDLEKSLPESLIVDYKTKTIIRIKNGKLKMFSELFYEEFVKEISKILPDE